MIYFDVSGIRNDRITDDIMRIKGFADAHIFSDIKVQESVEVRFEFCEDSGIDGYCMCEEDDSFLIEVSPSLRGEDLVRTLIHELIHVKQYLTGELLQVHSNDGRGPRVYWKKVDMTDQLYEDRPWEREAHSLEDRLCKDFFLFP